MESCGAWIRVPFLLCARCSFVHFTLFPEGPRLITLPQLYSLLPAETRDAYVSGAKKDTVPVIDLLPLGYSKVLGKGRIPEIPIVVKARWVSRLAEKKITDAGGVVQLVA